MWSLGDPEKVLYCNCAGNCKEPDLRKFSFFKHKIILMDEASPQLVINQKELFQAPPMWLKLGTSGTNCHAYDVFLSGVKIVICSNCWRSDLAQLKQEHQDWIQDNQIYYDTGYQPLYLTEAYEAFM